ncbi:hypothetical protein MW290_03165 [Aquincola tertiaricarbonis]|uniref:Uncharacterized protein n=1 Tax=Aquincola tertiaricarbonis TaxID=391953 RepID=A0ABY4S6H2_AQUTE|nr:hypothetical protein [Aquincola tertiaricarbonis]URI07637.1 hypothetical protein MW290_03165 [Aquincola tertiaricarbonis]
MSATDPEGSAGSPWLILIGLLFMILGRRQHARLMANVDAVEDLQAARAEEAAKTQAAKAATASAVQTAQALDEALKRLTEVNESLAESLTKQAEEEQRARAAKDHSQNPP